MNKPLMGQYLSAENVSFEPLTALLPGKYTGKWSGLWLRRVRPGVAEPRRESISTT